MCIDDAGLRSKLHRLKSNPIQRSSSSSSRKKMERTIFENNDLNLKATELTLGLPGRDESEQPSSPCVNSNKRSSSEMEASSSRNEARESAAPPPKAQVVGWPLVRSYRRNALSKSKSDGSVLLVKVSMDGAPYLRKIDLKFYNTYSDLLKALQNMFKCTIEKAKREAIRTAINVFDLLVKAVNGGVQEIFINEKRIEAEIRALTETIMRFSKQTDQ